MPTGSDPERGPAGPTISVVICAFTLERLETLGEAIESVRAQTRPTDEIVLVIDHADELLAESRSRWTNIRVVANREAPGLSGARNTGVDESSGDIVAFLDDDAVASPQWLGRLANAYSDERVVGAGGAVHPRWLEGRPRWFPAEFDWVVGCSHSGMPRERAAVRNLVGANMSFRRDALVEIGGFRRELGRIGTIPAGCEETDLCIRLAERWPQTEIVYDPPASVDHLVPPARGRLRYFTARCSAEGRSKAILTRLVGSGPGLSSERSYVRRTLPLGLLRSIRDTLRGDAAGAARAAMIAVGLFRTTVGYATGRGLVRSPHRADIERAATDEDTRNGLRILMVTPRSPLGQGGVERHVMEVGRRISATGVRIEVLCAEPGGSPIAEQRRDGIVIRSVRAWPAKGDSYLAPRLWREIARARADLIHVQSYHTAVAPLAMLRALTLGVPYVVTFHGGGHSSDLRNRLRRAQRRALRPLLARAERLIAVARFEIDLYGRELDLPREKFVLIPNGTDLTFGDVDARDAPGEPALLASVGRLERYKGHHRVISALPHVLEQQPDARLLVIGTGPYESALRSHAAELGVQQQVEFTSVQADDRNGMAALLRRVSLVVLLSDFETHPLVALEAAAAGRPLLVADRGGLAELAEDGVARAVSPEEAPQVVAQAIVEELTSPGKRPAPQLTSWDDCAAALLELYRSIARTT